MGSSDPEVLVDQASNLPATKETVLLLGLLFLQTDSSFEVRIMDDFCSPLKQSSRIKYFTKFGIGIPLIDDEDFKSSTESTISTSLIHCKASVENCKQVHTSVLNPIFQQAKVAGVGNLSKWRSEICSRCWSAPQFFE